MQGLFFAVASLHSGLRFSYLEASAVLGVIPGRAKAQRRVDTVGAEMKCRMEFQGPALTTGERISHTG